MQGHHMLRSRGRFWISDMGLHGVRVTKLNGYPDQAGLISRKRGGGFGEVSTSLCVSRGERQYLWKAALFNGWQNAGKE